MKASPYQNFEQLPFMLSVPELAATLDISRAAAYDLTRSQGFPALRIGKRIVVPKEQLHQWIRQKLPGGEESS